MKRAMRAAAIRLAALGAGLLATGLLVSALGIWLAGQIGTVPALLAMGCAAAVVAIILGLIAQRKDTSPPTPEAAGVAKAVLPTLVAILPRIGGRRAALVLSAGLVAMAVLLIGSESASKRNERND